MGKLHKIRKAFNRLPDREKHKLAGYSSGVWFWPNGEVRLWVFTESYRGYVRKLAQAWLDEQGRSEWE